MSYIPPHLRVSQDIIKPQPAATPISEQTTPTMPYIPPHLRRRRRPSHDDHHHEKGKTASSSTHVHPPTDVIHQHPHLYIRSVSDVIYRFMVLLHHEHMSCQHVKFTPFEGDTYTHLKHFQLYTLTPDLDHPPQQQNSTEVIEQIHINPASVICEAWKGDLKEVLEKFGRFAQGGSRDKMLPVILLRFGRILFHDRRALFDWGSSHTPENLERNVETRRLSKTFDAGLSREQFEFLHELACKDALHIQLEQRFTIQVADEMRPRSDLLCICYLLSDHNEQSVNPGKMDDQLEITGSAKHVLELKPVVLSSIRHMIGDISCGGKRCDIRLAFQIAEYPLTEMELCDFKSIFNKASSDDTTFQLNLYSNSGRFKVVGIADEIIRVVTGGGLKWYFHSSPSSYQAYVEPIICEEFCEGRKEWDTEKVILSIQELLQRVWADCII